MCSEYIVDIYQYMRKMETFFEVSLAIFLCSNVVVRT